MIMTATGPLAQLTSMAAEPAVADEITSPCGPSIAVSYLLAAFAMLAALVSAARILCPPRTRLTRRVRGAVWITAAAIAIGAGVWSAQLAGSVSCADRDTALFDPRLVILSALLVPLVTGIGLSIVAADPANSRRLLLGGVISGTGWSVASFLTIAALGASEALDYDFLLVALSIVMNVGTATVFCWVAFHLRGRQGARRTSGRAPAGSAEAIRRVGDPTGTPGDLRKAVVAALLLGAALRGGYYTALAASRRSPVSGPAWAPELDPFALGLVTAAGSTIVLMFIAVAAVGGLLPPRSAAWMPAQRRAAAVPASEAPLADAGSRDADDARQAASPGTIPATGTMPEDPPPAVSGTATGRLPGEATRRPAGDATRRPAGDATRRLPGEAAATPAAEAAVAALVDLTYEERTYVDLTRDELADDAVELLELADDDAGAGSTKAAIEDVLAVDPLAAALADTSFAMGPAGTTAGPAAV
ncbi:MHYT domain-containing protein, partial [Frankia nepalensis]